MSLCMLPNSVILSRWQSEGRQSLIAFNSHCKLKFQDLSHCDRLLQRLRTADRLQTPHLPVLARFVALFLKYDPRLIGIRELAKACGSAISIRIDQRDFPWSETI